jgi:hypothetical protein
MVSGKLGFRFSTGLMARGVCPEGAGEHGEDSSHLINL